jgi:hypothetical protein
MQSPSAASVPSLELTRFVRHAPVVQAATSLPHCRSATQEGYFSQHCNEAQAMHWVAPAPPQMSTGTGRQMPLPADDDHTHGMPTQPDADVQRRKHSLANGPCESARHTPWLPQSEFELHPAEQIPVTFSEVAPVGAHTVLLQSLDWVHGFPRSAADVPLPLLPASLPPSPSEQPGQASTIAAADSHRIIEVRGAVAQERNRP